MEHSEHLKRQGNIFEQVLAILKNDSRVLGIVTVGSYARGEQDAFSDIDVVCYLRDEERTGRPELYDQVGRIAPVLWKLWIYDLHALYLFENGVRLDLDFCRPSAISENSTYAYTDASILYDPEGVLGQSLTAVDKPRVAEHPKWFQPGDLAMVDWFFWMFRQIVCWAKRGAQGGYGAYNKLSNAVDSLAEVRTRLVEMRLWTSGIQDYLGRIDVECAQRIAQTYPHLTADEVIKCAKLLLDEYEYVCPVYCKKAGCIYPAHKVVIIRRLIAEFEQLT